jgi:hypothetical protein
MKRVFYYTDVLPFLSKNEAAIDKLRRNLEVFREAGDNIKLIWHPWSKTAEYLKINRSKVTDEYLAVVKKYCDEGWGELDETETYEEIKDVLLGCDAYYGDPSDMAYEAQNANIPVMLQNFEV